MTTMLTTLEGDNNETENDFVELEGDLYIADDYKVYYESSPEIYAQLGSIQEVFGCSQSELSGNSDFEEILNGEELHEINNNDSDLYIHKNGFVYYKSPLGGYSELGSIKEVFGCSHSELSGNSDFEEILNGDELGKGFKFKAPKMPKFKVPKIKFKAPKIKFKAPKINTKGFSKGISGIGKGISKGISSAGKAYSKHLSKIGEAVSAGVKGAGGLLESLMPGQEGQSQEEEQTEEPQEEEQYQEEIQEDNEDMTEEITDEMSGIHTDQAGNMHYYSELHGEYKELSGDELGFLSMLTSAASNVIKLRKSKYIFII